MIGTIHKTTLPMILTRQVTEPTAILSPGVLAPITDFSELQDPLSLDPARAYALAYLEELWTPVRMYTPLGEIEYSQKLEKRDLVRVNMLYTWLCYGMEDDHARSMGACGVFAELIFRDMLQAACPELEGNFHIRCLPGRMDDMGVDIGVFYIASPDGVPVPLVFIDSTLCRSGCDGDYLPVRKRDRSSKKERLRSGLRELPVIVFPLGDMFALEPDKGPRDFIDYLFDVVRPAILHGDYHAFIGLQRNEAVDRFRQILAASIDASIGYLERSPDVAERLLFARQVLLYEPERQP